MKRIFFIFSFLFLFFAGSAHAEIIHNFDTQITAQKDGKMEVKETIEYDFQDLDRHGIFRFIPLYSKVGNLYRIIEVKDVSVTRDNKKEKFSVTADKENINIKIGNPDKTISGNHIYKISYTVLNGIGSNFSDHDEIYWNATGNGWDTVIEKANATVTSDPGIKQVKLLCFQGPLGYKTQDCLISGNSASSSRLIGTEEGLTVVAVYPVGTFPKSILSVNPPQTFGDKLLALFLKNLVALYLLVNVAIPAYLLYWYEKHKNKIRFGPPSVNFDLPKDDNKERIPPAVAGTIDTATLSRDDVTATIFDLAIRKYIKLSEEKKVKSLRPDQTTQTITKLKEADDNLQTYEKTLFNRLFRDADTVDVSTLKVDFYLTFQSMEESVFSYLVRNKYYSKNPKIQKTLLLIASIFAISTANIILAGTLFFLSRKLNGRTALGDEIDYKIDGLKVFLKNMDRNYKWQAKNFYTVEQMIPYAMALGYIDKFMESLKILKPDYNPTWYSGYHGSFYTNYVGFSSGMTTNMTTSSSSGSGGGGSSGGGGGGGGGGSW